MPKVYSVSAALEQNLPYVEFRGRYYRLRDLTVRERVLQASEVMEEQERLESDIREEAEAAVREELGADAADEEVESEVELRVQDLGADRLQRIYADALVRALEDFPDEEASTVTEREFQALQAAIQAARESTMPAVRDDQDELESGKVGREEKGKEEAD